MKHILVVTGHAPAVEQFQMAFTRRSVWHAENFNAAKVMLSRKRPDLIFVDVDDQGLCAGSAHYREVIQGFKAQYPALEIVVMVSKKNVRTAVSAIKAGASNYITYPLEEDEIKLAAEWIREQAIVRSEITYLRGKFWHADAQELVTTLNPTMQQVYEMIRTVAPTRTNVLLYGETGTGKGVLANLIHRHSNRENGRFISVHCGAIPDTLLESELFGHEKGAFTGAVSRKLGKFEIANKGTIFLDEIGTITPSAQIKFLQVLQDGTFSRIGGEDALQTDARVIVATNSDLKKMSEEGLFRKDLYYRLNVFTIVIPPLRERTEDMDLLIGLFLRRLNAEMQKQIESVHPEVLEAMQQYDWPGNIRELENLMERAYILEKSSVLTPDGFPPELFGERKKVSCIPVDAGISLSEGRKKVVHDFEKQYVAGLMARHNGKINQSAEAAGITPRQLHKLMVKYRIRKEDYKN